MKAYLINSGDCFRIDKSPQNANELVNINIPAEVEILEIKDFHLFGDTSLDKNTKIIFKISGDDRVFTTNYGWIFIEHTDDALLQYHNYKNSLDEYEKAKSVKEYFRNKLPTLNKRNNV